jgi:hypothetical protein
LELHNRVVVTHSVEGWQVADALLSRHGKLTKLRLDCRWDWESLQLVDAVVREVMNWEYKPLGQITREHGGRFPAEFEAETLEEFIKD